jgi:site-specific DNA recombinase
MLAAIYARVSTERQERQQTITSQLAALRAWAEAEGHELNEEHVFHDEGFSGARLDRPGLDSLRDAVRDGAVTLVGVLAPDRLARKYAYQALLLEEFRRAGCTVAFLNHPISDDPGDQLLLQIQGAVAEYERALLSERFRRGKLQKARTGQLVGVHPPYGYRYLPRHDGVPGQMVVDATEAETVRMLYGWLTEERLTLRQILKHLNFGPWFPRCGRRPWSPSTVHHILSDSVYTGTAYANRYQYVAARKPRPRKPSYSGKGCRQLRPKEQWIPIPVPALIEAAVWDRAQAQLARNAVLSFRNNKKHDYLLRCLLTCGSCGLAMFGMTRPAAGNTWRRCYPCAGKDCIKTARSQPCPRASVNGEDLEQAVWSHVRELLGAPERLMAQFEHFVGDSDRSAARKTAAQRLAARLDGLARADARLLDAYQVEVISLEELTERRRQLAEQRRILDHQLEQERDLSRQQAKAQEVMADLTAFCHRVRDRLDKASFADKQAILQLIIERIIVHEDSLEIRHVIPLRSPPPGWNRPADEPNSRLRSDRVDPAALPRGADHPPDRRLEPLVRVGDDQLHTAQAATGHALEERGPERLGLARPDVQPDNLSFALGIHGHGDYGRDRDDAPALALLEVGRIQPEIGPVADERTVEEGPDTVVDVLAQLGDRALADPGQPHRLHQVVDAPCRDAADPVDPLRGSTLNHGDQRLLRRLPGLEERREVGALPQLGDAQL